MLLGAHMSIAGGLDRAVLHGHELGCETIQVFTRSPRQWRPRILQDEEIEAFRRAKEQTGIDPIIGHDCYLINLATTDEHLWRKSLAVLLEEIHHCVALDIPYLVMHPGSHLGVGEETGLKRIAAGLDAASEQVERGGMQILLENTAGQGSSLGSTFEQLAQVLHWVHDASWLGACFDTCHALAAGYELRTREGYETTWQEFDRLIGLDRLNVVHLNDAKGGLGSRLDRHYHIGKGSLGLEPFRMLLNDQRFRALPMLLETPKGRGDDEDKENLRVLRSLVVEADEPINVT
jgi:deoxyribonuclease-4